MCLPGMPCYTPPNDAFYSPEGNCLDCSATSNNVVYVGPNLPNSGVQSKDNLTTALKKLDDRFAASFILDTIAASPALKAQLCLIIKNC